jgi:HD-GYP domain-containing protein (c-di-GMP phosphodiesterase class II)
MQAHLAHALRVLDGVELDLPVAEAIAQMHERLDGTGYPQGLAGDAIGPAGRVLAVADVFLARTRPRSYRDAAPAAEVLAVLRDHPGRYDGRVVRALEEELAAGPG